MCLLSPKEWRNALPQTRITDLRATDLVWHVTYTATASRAATRLTYFFRLLEFLSGFDVIL